jgi:hypothetical protein
MSQLVNRRNLKDAELIVAKALPAAAANNSTDAIEIGGTGPHRERLKLRASIPTNTALVATKTLTLTLQDSADGTNFAPLVPGQAAVIAGKGGNGIDARSIDFDIPQTARKYIRVNQAVEADGGNNTGTTVTYALVS